MHVKGTVQTDQAAEEEAGGCHEVWHAIKWSICHAGVIKKRSGCALSRHLEKAWALAAHILAREANGGLNHVTFSPPAGVSLSIFSVPFAGPMCGLDRLFKQRNNH